MSTVTTGPQTGIATGSPFQVQANEDPTPDGLRELWQNDEILWFNNGRWGMCGYAIPNGQGKSWTLNPLIFTIHKQIGLMLFDLMHRQAVQFNEPPDAKWWWDWQKAILLLRSQIRAFRIDPGTTPDIDPMHVRSQRQTFVVYPVPFFGGRVRQEDCLDQCGLALDLLGEIMQHSSNEKPGQLDGTLVDVMESYLRAMFLRATTKYFRTGTPPAPFTREQVIDKDFSIPADSFSQANYLPQNWIPSTEMSTERPPMSWWPTENDLSKIKGVAYTTALTFAERWPITYLNGEGDWENTLPGIENLVAADPLMPGVKISTQKSTDASLDSQNPPA